MAGKKRDWENIGNFFVIGRKVGTSGLPVIKIRRKRSNPQNDAKEPPLTEKTRVRRPSETDTSKRVKNSKDIPPLLMEPSLQFPGTDRARPVDVVVGLDLGTAWTKAVIQDPTRRRAVAISFNEYGSAPNPFLLPTRVGFLNGHLTLCKSDDPNHICTDIKMSLMENRNPVIKMNFDSELTVTSCELAATFIALVLRYSRYSFVKTQANIYMNNRLRWHLNLGIPVKNYDDTLIKEEFHHAALVGWWLSEQAGEITLALAKEALQKISTLNFEPGMHRNNINVVPEVAAEVAGYAYSDLREEGLHMLIDIGATTLDASTFILNKRDGEDSYRFLSAAIGRYGAFELHRFRLMAFRKFLNTWLSKVDGIAEILEPIPDSCDHYLPPTDNIPNFDNEFIDQAAFPVARVVFHTKTKKLKISKAWGNGLPLFLCGGGSLAKFYSENLIYHVEHSLHGIEWKGFRAKQIPKPENLEAEGLKSHDYHRLAVAYGLSFQYDDIGHIIPPSDTPDMPPDPRRKGDEDRFISKDMV